MSSRKQRLDVGPSSSNSNSSSEPNKQPRKRRFDDSSETDNNHTNSSSNKSRDFNNMSQQQPTKSIATNLNTFTMQPYSQYYFELLKKRRQLPVWEYKEAFTA